MPKKNMFLGFVGCCWKEDISFPHRKEKQRTALFKYMHVFVMAAVVAQDASFPLWQLLMQQFCLPGRLRVSWRDTSKQEEQISVRT